MAGVINDYETLHKFRNELLDTVDDLRDQLRKTEKAMDDVAAVWKDMQFLKYEKEFSKDKEKIEPLCKDIEEFESDVLYPLEKLLVEYGNL
ncbi:MAG: hypothetical protein NC308_05975 [Clostridium sp.]|nr:hypothetical protein [Bacteroides sp.]MCM1198417.1 hypothetical protein [Clostridium sp.]